jgi:putative nucleotidyltransferase with HDIG domain
LSEADDNRLIDAILASGVKIPPMPAALLDVLQLERYDDAGAREYAAVIARDPALAGSVFRVAGSPVMGLRTKPDTLEQAITVLGLRTTVAVVRSEGLRGALHDPALEAVMNSLWKRMNAVADLVLATVRKARLRGLREDLAFQAGIFHDCGVAVLCRRDPAYAHAFGAAGVWPDLAALDAAHNTSHAVVGLMVARNWQLPPDVAQTVRQHHDRRPEALPESVRALCVLVQFACYLLARKSGIDDSEWETVWKEHAEALFRHASMDLAELEAELLSSLP